ncbi:MAG: 3,4-dihydroxy 2-butanone 4-phosphate synthase/GTP cyclohydrolase II [Myxococcota bacterium]|jgi:3,4-dihydroxy 2-butanone 4-phosphate synthase/GTP cyclohydrolase II
MKGKSWTNEQLKAAVTAFAAGKMIVVLDDQGEGHGILACSAPAADADAVNVMATDARGLVCIGITRERARHLGLSAQADASGGPAYTISIEAAEGVTTGISAADRAQTIKVTIDPTAGPADVVSPGHLFPVMAHPGGVLAHRGPAEAVVDIASLAGMAEHAGAYCHVLSENGDEANRDELQALADRLDCPLVRMSDIASHRTSTEDLVREVGGANMPTSYGPFDVSVWENLLDGTQHVLLRLGASTPTDGLAPLVRVHSQCLTGDAFKSHRCDCGQQLDMAMARVVEHGAGAVLYLRQEGRGIGLVAKLRAYELQDRGRDTVQANEELGYAADLREYGIGAQILLHAGYKRLRLMTNNPRKIAGLQAVGIDVQERVAIETEPREENLRYLRAKKAKLGHLLATL